MRTALLCVIVQRVVEISHRRFGTTYRSIFNGQTGTKMTLKVGTVRLFQNVCRKLPLSAKILLKM